MSKLQCELFATEDGEPWAGFVYGHHDPALVASAEVRSRILAETRFWDIAAEANENMLALMAEQPPAHLWIHQDGEFEDSPFQFCDADAKGAIAITGWRLL